MSASCRRKGDHSRIAMPILNGSEVENQIKYPRVPCLYDRVSVTRSGLRLSWRAFCKQADPVVCTFVPSHDCIPYDEVMKDRGSSKIEERKKKKEKEDDKIKGKLVEC